MRLLRTTCLAAGLMAAALVAAQAAEPSGTVLAAVQMAEATGPGGKLVLKPETPIYAGDKIVTGPVGEAQIRFIDDTRLVVGPNSQLVIDSFVFSGTTARNVSINALRGAFRFISGDSPSGAYKITTPTATIGVRGTEFDVDVDEVGSTRVANFSGITRICDRFANENTESLDPRDKNRFRGCVETQGACSVSLVERGRDIRRFSDRFDRNRELNWYFRYVRDQSRLLGPFQVSLAQCGDRTPQRIEFSPTPTPDNPPPPPPPPPPPCKHKCGGDKPDKPSWPHKPDKHEKHEYRGEKKPSWSGPKHSEEQETF